MGGSWIPCIDSYAFGSEIQQAIKERDYSALLFGEVLDSIRTRSVFGILPKRKTGTESFAFDDKKADAILEDARQILDDEKRKPNMLKLQMSSLLKHLRYSCTVRIISTSFQKQSIRPANVS